MIPFFSPYLSSPSLSFQPLSLFSQYFNEISFNPGVIFNSFISSDNASSRLDASVSNIWILCGGVVTPYDDVADHVVSHTHFSCNLSVGNEKGEKRGEGGRGGREGGE